MSTSTAHGIHFQGQRLGGLVAWDADNNFIAVDFVSEPYPAPLLVCVFEPRCPEGHAILEVPRLSTDDLLTHLLWLPGTGAKTLLTVSGSGAVHAWSQAEPGQELATVVCVDVWRGVRAFQLPPAAGPVVACCVLTAPSPWDVGLAPPNSSREDRRFSKVGDLLTFWQQHGLEAAFGRSTGPATLPLVPPGSQEVVLVCADGSCHLASSPWTLGLASGAATWAVRLVLRLAGTAVQENAEEAGGGIGIGGTAGNAGSSPPSPPAPAAGWPLRAAALEADVERLRIAHVAEPRRRGGGIVDDSKQGAGVIVSTLDLADLLAVRAVEAFQGNVPAKTQHLDVCALLPAEGSSNDAHSSGRPIALEFLNAGAALAVLLEGNGVDGRSRSENAASRPGDSSAEGATTTADENAQRPTPHAPSFSATLALLHCDGPGGKRSGEFRPVAARRVPRAALSACTDGSLLLLALPDGGTVAALRADASLSDARGIGLAALRESGGQGACAGGGRLATAPGDDHVTASTAPTIGGSVWPAPRFARPVGEAGILDASRASAHALAVELAKRGLHALLPGTPGWDVGVAARALAREWGPSPLAVFLALGDAGVQATRQPLRAAAAAAWGRTKAAALEAAPDDLAACIRVDISAAAMLRHVAALLDTLRASLTSTADGSNGGSGGGVKGESLRGGGNGPGVGSGADAGLATAPPPAGPALPTPTSREAAYRQLQVGLVVQYWSCYIADLACWLLRCACLWVRRHRAAADAAAGAAAASSGGRNSGGSVATQPPSRAQGMKAVAEFEALEQQQQLASAGNTGTASGAPSHAAAAAAATSAARPPAWPRGWDSMVAACPDTVPGVRCLHDAGFVRHVTACLATATSYGRQLQKAIEAGRGGHPPHLVQAMRRLAQAYRPIAAMLRAVASGPGENASDTGAAGTGVAAGVTGTTGGGLAGPTAAATGPSAAAAPAAQPSATPAVLSTTGSAGNTTDMLSPTDGTTTTPQDAAPALAGAWQAHFSAPPLPVDWRRLEAALAPYREFCGRWAADTAASLIRDATDVGIWPGFGWSDEGVAPPLSVQQTERYLSLLEAGPVPDVAGWDDGWDGGGATAGADGFGEVGFLPTSAAVDRQGTPEPMELDAPVAAVDDPVLVAGAFQHRGNCFWWEPGRGGTSDEVRVDALTGARLDWARQQTCISVDRSVVTAELQPSSLALGSTAAWQGAWAVASPIMDQPWRTASVHWT